MSGMRTILALAALLIATLFELAGARAGDVKVGALQISTPWARATPKSAPVGGGYLKITNTGSTPDRLIGGSTSISGRFEIHEMSMSGSTMKMRQLTNGLEIKPGETVELKPGGSHIMFVQLKDRLQQGQHFKATLEFEKAGKVDVDFDIAGIGATTPAAAGHGEHGNMKMK